MGTISSGIGLISGIDTATLIDQLIALEARGKLSLQSRLARLQTQKAAILDINSRLLGLKSAASGFRINKIFASAIAASSNDTVLTATAGAGAQPGNFTFIVKQLVSTHQLLSRGFADQSTTPLGLESISFEFGKGKLQRDRALADLNGGAGVRRGQIVITDRSGAQATIDLRDATTLDEVISRINDNASINVTASASGDRLAITDNTGSTASNLIVADAVGSFTAADLGLVGSVAGATITGSVINSLGAGTAIASLNDGLGVLVRNNVADIRITARDGTALDVGLGRIDAPIDTDTLLSELNNGSGVTISDDDENNDIKFIARDGTEYEVNLTGITTVGGLITRVSNQTGGHIAISVHADGDRLVVTDTVGGAGNLRVEGAGDNGTETAEDLGLLNAAGAAADSFDGAVIPNTISDPPVVTIQNVIDRIANADGNNGKIVASIAADGVSLEINDTTGGGGNLVIRGAPGSSDAVNAAAHLGIFTGAAGVASSTVSGSRLVSSLNSVLIRNLNGGSGLAGGSTLTLTDRQGDSVIVNNLDTPHSLSDLVQAINDAITAAGNVNITVGYNASGNGLQITDTSGSTAANLIVTGDAAAALGIEANVAADSIRGTDLEHRYVGEATKLADLNYGRGIGLGKFRIIDGFGETATVNIASDSVTLQDVIAEINSRGLAIQARVNDTGDGLLIEQDPAAVDTPFRKIKIETVSGSTARDLRILGESADIENGFIDGSYERIIDLNTSDNLAQVRNKINQAGIPISASIINTGSGATPFRLSITSGLAGARGELLIDSGAVDLGLESLTRGRDAKVFFGSSDISQAFLVTSSTNQITNVVEGVTIDLLSTSDQAVTVTVTRDEQAILGAVQGFVTAFNDAIDRIKAHDFFDLETEKKGALLGDPTVARVRSSLYRVLQQRAVGVDGPYQFLSQVGLRLGKEGRIEFNETRFRDALTSDPAAVEALFASFQSTTTTTEEIEPGVTVSTTDKTFTKLGFGDLFDQLLDSLTNSTNGVVTLTDRNLQTRMDLGQDRLRAFDERLERRREQLQRQFAAMEATLARLQGQGSALQSLTANIALAQRLGADR